jgi:MFS family permease
VLLKNNTWFSTQFVLRCQKPKTLLLVVLPVFTSHWVLILIARPLTAVWLLLNGRGVAGFALGITLGVVPSYIIDISSPKYQGLFALGAQLMFSIGLLFVYVLGAVLTDLTAAHVCYAAPYT